MYDSARGLQLSGVGQSNIFGPLLNFFGQKTAAKNEKKNFFSIFLNKNIEIISSTKIKCPKSVFY